MNLSAADIVSLQEKISGIHDSFAAHEASLDAKGLALTGKEYVLEVRWLIFVFVFSSGDRFLFLDSLIAIITIKYPYMHSTR